MRGYSCASGLHNNQTAQCVEIYVYHDIETLLAVEVVTSQVKTLEK